MRHTIFTAALILVAASGPASGQGTPRQVDLASAPATITSAVERANAAIQELQSTLLARLSGELATRGPAAAVAVCRDEALQLTSSIAARRMIAIGRTSHRLRNPANAARPWAAATVASHAGRKVADASPVVFDLGGRVGVMRPIGTVDFCLQCHGAPATVEASLGEVLKSSYPKDQAVGFAAGDLRGWVWAEVPISAETAP